MRTPDSLCGVVSFVSIPGDALLGVKTVPCPKAKTREPDPVVSPSGTPNVVL